MKARVLLTTLISFLLLCAVVAAGLNAVFTVTSVEAEFSILSAEGEKEAKELKEKLDGFIGKSSTFLDEEEVRDIIASYPCMKAERVEKKYPSTLGVTVSERRETFSVMTEHGYAVLSDDGTCLYYKDSLINRIGGENILLDGFSFSIAQGEALSDENFNTVLTAYGVLCEVLKEPRANVVSIAYRGGLVFDTFVVAMREGIRIEIVSPAELTAEKMRQALLDENEGYLVRSDGERLCGTITVVGSDDGIHVDYDASRN